LNAIVLIWAALNAGSAFFMCEIVFWAYLKALKVVEEIVFVSYCFETQTIRECWTSASFASGIATFTSYCFLFRITTFWALHYAKKG